MNELSCFFLRGGDMPKTGKYYKYFETPANQISLQKHVSALPVNEY